MTKRGLFFATGFAVAGGLLSGLLFVPPAGGRVRRELARRAQLQRGRLEAQLRAVEARLGALEQQIQATGEQFSQRVRAATGQAVGRYVPLVEDPPPWGLDPDELARDLPHLPNGRVR